MTFFDTTIIVRLREEQVNEIDSYIEKNRDKYENRSHFIRSAIIKLLKEVKP